MQLMNVEGLTRENVASHLQKYRLQLRREPSKVSCLPCLIVLSVHAERALVPKWPLESRSASASCRVAACRTDTAQS